LALHFSTVLHDEQSAAAEAAVGHTTAEALEDQIYHDDSQPEDTSQTKTNPTTSPSTTAAATTEKEILTLDENDNEKYMAQIMFMQTTRHPAAQNKRPGMPETSVYLPHTDPQNPIFQTVSSVAEGGAAADKTEMIHPPRRPGKSEKLSSNLITFT
jgi:hypothetical protein